MVRLIESAVRVTIVAIGGPARPVAVRPLARLATLTPARALPIAIAALLAVGAGEFVLRLTRMRPIGWLVDEMEPRRRPDPRLGWTLVPNRTGAAPIGGRTVDYAIDPAGYRVPSA